MGILDFLGVRGYFLSKIPKFRIPKTRIPKSRHCERSEAISRNSRFYLKFPTMSSPSLPCVILGLDPRISIWNSRILEFLNDINTKSP